MRPVKFPGVNKVYAEDQPEYTPLPVIAIPGDEGEVISCWNLSADEFERLKETRCVYLHQWTFNGPLQPVKLEVDHVDPIIELGDSIVDTEKGTMRKKNNEVNLTLRADQEKQRILMGVGEITLTFSRDEALRLANEILERAFKLTATKKR